MAEQHENVKKEKNAFVPPIVPDICTVWLLKWDIPSLQ